MEQRRRAAAREVAKIRKNGRTVSPVLIEGRQIAATFWGKAWCDNLESYRDYENRLPRGRTYVRNGSVIDLQIAPREVTATVSGSSIYRVSISIGVVPAAHWQAICADCSGGIDSLVELLQGRLSKGVMERLCRQANGLLPKPSEIRFSCTCPDGATMCKHVAAAMYGVGARLDKSPELLFRLRAVDEKDLVADVGKALPVSNRASGANILDSDDLSRIFGLDMAGADRPVEAVGDVQAAMSPPAKPSGASRKPSGKGTPAAKPQAPARGKPDAKRSAAKQGAWRRGSKVGQTPASAHTAATAAMRAAVAPVQKAADRKTAAAKAAGTKPASATTGAAKAAVGAALVAPTAMTTAPKAAEPEPAKARGTVPATAKAKAPEPVKWWLPGYGAKVSRH
jgi:uncharacterized Zn finger protein